MRVSAQRGLAFALAAILTVAVVGTAVADDSLALALDLYAQAAYEDALAMLNRLSPANSARPEDRSVVRYRALCLLALGRTAEAQQAIEIVVAADPSFHPTDTDVSPRVRSAFSDVRRRMLPAIAQQKYGLAKAAFDRKDFAAAADGFGQVVEMLRDPDLGLAANQTPLSDLRLLAGGFRDLSVSAAAPPPPPVSETLPEVAPAPKAPPGPRIYSSEDGNVVPPLVVRQTMPPFPARAFKSAQGALAVIVDEKGAVESAAILLPLGPAYDHLVLDAAKGWKYKPAMVDGVAVKFRRVIQINLAPKGS